MHWCVQILVLTIHINSFFECMDKYLLFVADCCQMQYTLIIAVANVDIATKFFQCVDNIRMVGHIGELYRIDVERIPLVI
jgi:hypothetical protein